jgi:sugar lactone lactonase YvrE
MGMRRLLITGLMLSWLMFGEAGQAKAEVIYAITVRDTLISFDSATPGALISSSPVTGLQAGEALQSIDFDPNTGRLYAISSLRILYTVELTTGVVTPVSTLDFWPQGSDGFDFNPVTGRLRIVNFFGENLRINAETGETIVDEALTYAAADPNAGRVPRVDAIAYTSNVPGATSTLLYGIDFDTLVVQDPDDAGVLTTIGPLGTGFGGPPSFDVSGVTGTAFASSVRTSVSSDLYTINLSTGEATRIGGIGGGNPVRGLSAAPAPAPRRFKRYVLPGDAVFPEGIAYQPETDHFFVSSAADGTIYRGALGVPEATPFLEGGGDGRTAAAGLKIDRRGRLFVAGAETGLIFVYNSRNGELLARLDTGTAPATFINDVVVTHSGDAYFTDSVNPVLYKVTENDEGQLVVERFMDFTGTTLAYQPGVNANGIVASSDGKYLIVIQSNTGKLFRISTATRRVTEVEVHGGRLTAGDGLLLRGHQLYVVRNRQGVIATVRLTTRYTSGRVISTLTDKSFRFPTTMAFARGRLLVVNSQSDRRGTWMGPELPFTVSSVRVP